MWETLSGEDVRKRGQGRMMRVYFLQVHSDKLGKLLNEILDLQDTQCVTESSFCEMCELHSFVLIKGFNKIRGSLFWAKLVSLQYFWGGDYFKGNKSSLHKVPVILDVSWSPTAVHRSLTARMKISISASSENHQ